MKKAEPFLTLPSFKIIYLSAYFLILLPIPTSPTRPKPRSNRVAGSGTGERVSNEISSMAKSLPEAVRFLLMSDRFAVVPSASHGTKNSCQVPTGADNVKSEPIWTPLMLNARVAGAMGGFLTQDRH